MELNIPATLLAESDGRRLAVDMLLELQAVGSDQTAIDGSNREGRPQSDILNRYLAQARLSCSLALEAGLLSVLTDYLGSTLDGAVPDPEFYEKHLEPTASNRNG